MRTLYFVDLPERYSKVFDGLVYMSGKQSKNIGSQVNHSLDEKTYMLLMMTV